MKYMQNKKDNRSINKDYQKKEKKIEISKTYTVTHNCLLLDYLLEVMSSQSRNVVKTILKNKCVLVNGVCTTRFDYELNKKDVIQISKNPVVKVDNEAFKLDIIYEDEEFIVINKPNGLLSIADDKENSKTAYHYLAEYVRKSNPKAQIFVVHRIDKETSGVLMVAKNSIIRDKLQDEWNNIVKEREYYALVNGTFKDKKGTIKSYLTETKTHMVFSSKGKEGKLAVTNYEVIKENKNYSLLKVNIDSGRKNQIRVHMAESGHPIVGDDKYGDGKSPIKRLGLHASKLVFIHPINHKTYSFNSNVPSSFKTLFNER